MAQTGFSRPALKCLLLSIFIGTQLIYNVVSAVQQSEWALYVCAYIHTRVRVLSHLSCVQLLSTPWTVAHQAPLDSPGKNTGVGCHALPQDIYIYISTLFKILLPYRSSQSRGWSSLCCQQALISCYFIYSSVCMHLNLFIKKFFLCHSSLISS